MRKLKGLLANLLAIAIVLGVPGHIALKVEEQLGFISELIPHVHTHEDEDTGGLSDWLTPGIVIAHADGSVQDGDNQFQQSGSDANSDNHVDNGAFGCWRLWLGTKENGTPVSKTTDCGPMSPPWPEGTQTVFGRNTKLQARGGSIGAMPGRYAFKPVDTLPPLGTSIGGLKEFWEQDDYRAFKNCMSTTGWSESDLEKYKAGEYVIVMEPVGWVKFSGVWFALSSTELAALNQGMGNLLRERMGTFTHGELPGYAWLETNDWQAGWGIPAGTGFSGLLSDATSMST